MSVHQNQTIGTRQARYFIPTLHQLLSSLTNRGAIFRNDLVKGHRLAAAAPAPQDDFRYAWLFLQKLDARLHIKRNGFETNQSFVVVRSRVHAQNGESPFREFGAGEGAHE